MLEQPDSERRQGPGATDWLVALACSVLIAAEVQTQGARWTLQSAASYYFGSPWVPQIHLLALVIDGAMLALVAVWLLGPWKRACQTAMAVTAVIGTVLCWSEVAYALRLQVGAVYTLASLPFRPINNVGALGAQVFVTYLILRAPSGRLVGWRAWAVKFGLALAFWFFQATVWQMAVPR